MGGACEQASELQQFHVILPLGQLDDTFALAWDRHIIAGICYYINTGAGYSRTSECFVSKDVIA